jgi:hypothetical protein
MYPLSSPVKVNCSRSRSKESKRYSSVSPHYPHSDVKHDLYELEEEDCFWSQVIQPIVNAVGIVPYRFIECLHIVSGMKSEL